MPAEPGGGDRAAGAADLLAEREEEIVTTDQVDREAHRLVNETLDWLHAIEYGFK